MIRQLEIKLISLGVPTEVPQMRQERISKDERDAEVELLLHCDAV